jgi:hypothetical protein
MIDYEKENARAAAAPTTTEFLIPTNAKLRRRVATAATWLWAFAGGSVINWVLSYVSVPFRSPVNLYATDLSWEIAHWLGSVSLTTALLENVLLLGCLVLLGFRMMAWRAAAFITAIGLVAVDTWLVYAYTQLGIWSFLVHGLSIYYLVLGLKAAQLLRQRRAEGKA